MPCSHQKNMEVNSHNRTSECRLMILWLLQAEHKLFSIQYSNTVHEKKLSCEKSFGCELLRNKVQVTELDCVILQVVFSWHLITITVTGAFGRTAFIDFCQGSSLLPRGHDARSELFLSLGLHEILVPKKGWTSETPKSWNHMKPETPVTRV